MDQVIVDLVNRFPADGGEDALRSLLEPHLAKQLRTACVKLKLNPQSRTAGAGNKPGSIDFLLKYHSDKVDGEVVATGPTKETPKQTERRVSQHDIFLLVNIMFSEAFIDRMSEADKNQSRSTIDTHAVNEGSPYWKDITRTYNEEQEKHKGLVPSRQQYQRTHPEQAVKHSAAKLMDMWKKLSSWYTVAHGKSKLSGDNDREFFGYCKGRIDVLYLHDWLQIRPNHTRCAEGCQKRLRCQHLMDQPSVTGILPLTRLMRQALAATSDAGSALRSALPTCWKRSVRRRLK